MGPAQMITDKLKLYLTYQVSAWVRVGTGAFGPQIVNVALSVDGQWVNGGQIEASDDGWREMGGSFRLEKQPSKVMVYLQGPSSGVDLMVGGLQIFPVDRCARFRCLDVQIDLVIVLLLRHLFDIKKDLLGEGFECVTRQYYLCHLCRFGSAT